MATRLYLAPALALGTLLVAAMMWREDSNPAPSVAVRAWHSCGWNGLVWVDADRGKQWARCDGCGRRFRIYYQRNRREPAPEGSGASDSRAEHHDATR